MRLAMFLFYEEINKNIIDKENFLTKANVHHLKQEAT